MELSFSSCKKKKVVNVVDGRLLGHVTDVIFTYPDCKVTGLIVGNKTLFNQEEYLVSVCCINKVGDDTILVALTKNAPQTCTDEQTE